jgi:DNA ligase-1
MKYLAGFLIFFSQVVAASSPGLQLANVYHDNIKIDNYWVSEKYDGVRAFWDGEQLLSRQGNPIHAPTWFVEPLPDEQLDGELWIDRGMFDQVSGIIRRQTPDDKDWQSVRYMVFDLPASSLIFDDRLLQLKAIVTKVNRPHVRLVKQYRVTSGKLLKQKLDEVVAAGGEGLMLHLGSSTYKAFRTDDLLKVKKHSDAEAVVIKHFAGKGKYKGMMGSMLVQTLDGKRFKIGSGFSNAERENPPAPGTVITFKYFGLTSKGTPRFASFLRERKAH